MEDGVFVAQRLPRLPRALLART